MLFPMTSWLPRITWTEYTACEDWGEYEGHMLVVEWLGWHLGVQLGRVDRVVGEDRR